MRLYWTDEIRIQAIKNIENECHIVGELPLKIIDGGEPVVQDIIHNLGMLAEIIYEEIENKKAFRKPFYT